MYCCCLQHQYCLFQESEVFVDSFDKIDNKKRSVYINTPFFMLFLLDFF